ncbi:sensor histidine kinase [Lysinibacillus sp. 2017]|uniref:HAMP domain-containing sensor histidine kinase n=1 Tax=unclassified Lysinibacillus TaxID=2636778 RepID=UPI000D52573D|nr:MULTISPECIES: HAMP domain-containing sensor histidine kinase [unclassified Lysinibacillus]AWE07865.1 sensor histidine kinase [Lysinibacillus sp. 2017]
MSQYHLGAFSFFCIVLGTTLTIFFSKKALNPLRQVIDATHQVAGGDFTTKINVKGIVELEELSTSFNKMTHELENIETLRSDFINNFSHELKTPLVSIRGFAKLLKNQQLTQEEREEYLNIILLESDRLAGLSTNLLTLSKYEHLDIIPEKALFQLDEQIRRILVLLEPKWAAKQLDLDVDLEPVLYHGNADLMAHIWLNLIDNAIKFSEQNGTITVKLVQADNGITFLVKDEGIGMSEEATQRIFEKFYQGDASHNAQGYGIGLALVKRLVKLCDGQITVESQPGAGSTFTVIFSVK